MIFCIVLSAGFIDLQRILNIENDLWILCAVAYWPSSIGNKAINLINLQSVPHNNSHHQYIFLLDFLLVSTSYQILP